MKIKNKYELIPTNGMKSFGGKAIVIIFEDGTEILQSYKTDVLKRNKDGSLTRLYDDWTRTTGSHIKSYCGLNKKEFQELRIEE